MGTNFPRCLGERTGCTASNDGPLGELLASRGMGWCIWVGLPLRSGDQPMSDPVFRTRSLVKHAPSSFCSFIRSLVRLFIDSTIEHLLCSRHGQGAEDTLVSKGQRSLPLWSSQVRRRRQTTTNKNKQGHYIPWLKVTSALK